MTTGHQSPRVRCIPRPLVWIKEASGILIPWLFRCLPIKNASKSCAAFGSVANSTKGQQSALDGFYTFTGRKVFGIVPAAQL